MVIPAEMIQTEKLIECVPNFSEGRNQAVVEQIIDCFRGRQKLKLLDYSSDPDHNRMVVTVVGEPRAVQSAVVDAIGVAVREIDLSTHQGVHPRIGAADVVPFIPIRNVTLEEAVQWSKEVAKTVAERFDLPVYLYEASSAQLFRKNLASIRKGNFEGLAEKMTDPAWKPDFGPDSPHPTAGASVIGARNFLIAYNINLRTNDLSVAKAIAQKIRFSSGGLESCKALGLPLETEGMVQVSINLTNFNQTGLHQVFSAVQAEAAKAGVEIANSELIGLLPLQALVDTTAHLLKFDHLTVQHILEYKLWE